MNDKIVVLRNGVEDESLKARIIEKFVNEKGVVTKILDEAQSTGEKLEAYAKERGISIEALKMGTKKPKTKEFAQEHFDAMMSRAIVNGVVNSSLDGWVSELPKGIAKTKMEIKKAPEKMAAFLKSIEDSKVQLEWAEEIFKLAQEYIKKHESIGG